MIEQSALTNRRLSGITSSSRRDRSSRGSRRMSWLFVIRRLVLSDDDQTVDSDREANCQRLPQMEVIGPLLFLQPLRGVIRGVFLERSDNPNLFYVRVFVQPLWVPVDHLIFNLGDRIGGAWRSDSPTLFTNLRVALAEPVSSIQQIQTITDAAVGVNHLVGQWTLVLNGRLVMHMRGAAKHRKLSRY